jgi:hypothetical protein
MQQHGAKPSGPESKLEPLDARIKRFEDACAKRVAAQIAQARAEDALEVARATALHASEATSVAIDEVYAARAALRGEATR